MTPPHAAIMLLSAQGCLGSCEPGRANVSVTHDVGSTASRLPQRAERCSEPHGRGAPSFSYCKRRPRYRCAFPRAPKPSPGTPLGQAGPGPHATAGLSARVLGPPLLPTRPGQTPGPSCHDPHWHDVGILHRPSPGVQRPSKTWGSRRGAGSQHCLTPTWAKTCLSVCPSLPVLPIPFPAPRSLCAAAGWGQLCLSHLTGHKVFTGYRCHWSLAGPSPQLLRVHLRRALRCGGDEDAHGPGAVGEEGHIPVAARGGARHSQSAHRPRQRSVGKPRNGRSGPHGTAQHRHCAVARASWEEGTADVGDVCSAPVRSVRLKQQRSKVTPL